MPEPHTEMKLKSCLMSRPLNSQSCIFKGGFRLRIPALLLSLLEAQALRLLLFSFDCQHLASRQLEHLTPFCLTSWLPENSICLMTHSSHGPQNVILSGIGGVGKGEGSQVSTTQLTLVWPHKVYYVTSGCLFDSSGGCKECSNISLVLKRRKQRWRSMGACSRHLTFSRDRTLSGMFPSDIPSLFPIAEFLCPFLGNLKLVCLQILERKQMKGRTGTYFYNFEKSNVCILLGHRASPR